MVEEHANMPDTLISDPRMDSQIHDLLAGMRVQMAIRAGTIEYESFRKAFMEAVGDTASMRFLKLYQLQERYLRAVYRILRTDAAATTLGNPISLGVMRSAAQGRLPSTADLKITGNQLLEAYEACEQDDAVWEQIMSIMLKTSNEPDLYYDMSRLFIHTVKWSACGFPLIRLTAKQAAAFAFTDIGDDELEEWRMPWPALVIELPHDFFGEGYKVRRLCVNDFNSEIKLPKPEEVIELYGKEALTDKFKEFGDDSDETIADRVNRLIKMKRDRRKCVAVRVDINDFNLWSGDRTPAEMYDDARITTPSLMLRRERELDSAERRVIILARRIVLNTIIEANIPASMKPAKIIRMKRRGKKKQRKPVEVESKTDLALVREIKIDATRSVRDYVSGEPGRVMKVRWIVRGHWRNQAWGKGRKKRRLRYIEPHYSSRQKLPLAGGGEYTIEEGSPPSESHESVGK